MGESKTKQYDISARNSFCAAQSVKKLCDVHCKSDINVQRNKEHHEVANLRNFRNYNKKYDILPVKDSSISQSNGYMEDKESLTNSELDKLEMNIFKNMSNSQLEKLEMNILKNMSNEFRRDNNIGTSLESNIKLFKTTVQEIFDNFYASMSDFEIYKKRFHEILAKNQMDAVEEMEDFINDMIHHIMSPDTMTHDGKITSNNIDGDFNSKTYAITEETSIISNRNENKGDICVNNQEELRKRNCDSNSFNDNMQPVVEAYKNIDYTTDSTMDDTKFPKFQSNTSTAPNEDVLNIVLNGAIQTKMKDRNLLSESNIKESALGYRCFASVDNMRKMAAKKREIEKYTIREQDYDDSSDREIPVKVSYAKRNIPLDEDFVLEHHNGKSFIYRLCDFLCKRFRRS